MNRHNNEDFDKEAFEETVIEESLIGDYPNGEHMTDEELDKYFNEPTDFSANEEPKPPAEVSYTDVNIWLIVAFILGILFCLPLLLITIVANIYK